MNGLVGIVAASERCSDTCSERRRPSLISVFAVAALHMEAHRTGIALGSPGWSSGGDCVEIAKNLWSRLEECQWIVETPALGVFDCNAFEIAVMASIAATQSGSSDAGRVTRNCTVMNGLWGSSRRRNDVLTRVRETLRYEGRDYAEFDEPNPTQATGTREPLSGCSTNSHSKAGMGSRKGSGHKIPQPKDARRSSKFFKQGAFNLQ